MRICLFPLVCLVMASCQPKPDVTDNREQFKKEILQTEKDFEKMAAEKGIKEAFLFYASDSVAINRFNLIYKGKKQVTLYFDYVKMNNARLQWTPDYVDVSSSGDMAYTYGKYTYTHNDSTGKEIVNKGVFHTVWKKQKDGKWKFVWD